MSAGDRPRERPTGLASLVGLWDDCDPFVDHVQEATSHRPPPRDPPDLDAEGDEPPEKPD